MNGVVGVERDADQELGIKNILIMRDEIVRHHRIHVMYVDPVMDLKARQAEITPTISCNNHVADLSPQPGSIEILVHVAVVAERVSTDNASKFQVLEAILLGLEST